MLLVKIVNDLFIACDKKIPTLILLLDLSATFDTVDQKKLLEILWNDVGIHGTAYSWFKSYLLKRTQILKIGDSYSEEEKLLYGVLQGSVVGPVLFNIYTRSFYQDIQSIGFDMVGFADDHQLMRPFNVVFQVNSLGSQMQKCFDAIGEWMNTYFLRLNAEKEKY